MTRLLLTFALLSIFSVCNSVAASNTGSVDGRVILSGGLPSPIPQSVTMDVGVCGGTPRFSETFVGDDRGGLGNVAVLLEPQQAEVAHSRDTAILNQTGCAFVPHVLVVPPGTTVEFENSDPVMHNIRIKSTQKQGFNETLGPHTFLRRELHEAEIVPVECEMHPWMKAWIVVANTPYFQLSDAHGNFNFSSIPSGDYTLVLWHEALGFKKIPVHVEGSRVSRLNVIWTMSRKK